MRRYGIVLGTMAVATALAVGDGHLAAATGPRLTAITATDGARPAVLIEASEPVAYLTARPDPFTVLVDLRNVAAAGYANGFTASPDSPVRQVGVETVRGADGLPLTRVRVSLAEPIAHRVRSQRNVIFVELDRDDALDAAATAPSPAAHPATAGIAAHQAATELQTVRSSTGPGGTSIVLVGNGRLAASRIERAGPTRLYLDFPGVNATLPATTMIKQGPIDRVRIALNSRDPLVTRVVVDLSRPAAHALSTAGDGHELTVTFREQGNAAGASATVVPDPPAAVPAAPAAPGPQPDTDGPVIDLTKPAPAGATEPEVVESPRPPPPAVKPAPAVLQPGGPSQGTTQIGGAPGKQYTGHPVSLDFTGADLRAVLRTFAEISGLNIVIDPAVQGSVDVSLRDVPWDQALDIILRANKLGYSVDGTIVRVAPLTVLADEEKQRRALTEQQALAGELRVMTVSLSYATAEQVKPLLIKSALSQRGTIEVDARSNTLIISDLQPALDRASQLIATLDRAQP